LWDFSRRVVIVLLLVLLFAALTCLLYAGLTVILEVFGGALFALFLFSLAHLVKEHTRLSYGWALGVVIVVLLLLLGGFGWLLADRLASQAHALSQQLPQGLERIRAYLGESEWGRVLLANAPNTQQVLAGLARFLNVSGLLTGLFGFIVAAVVVVIVGVFGAAEPDVYRAGVLRIVPPAHRARAAEAIDTLAYNLRWWLIGQAVLMVTLAVTTALGLSLIGVPFALTLGLLAGLFEVVPYIGPWLSAAPAALIALTLGPYHLLATVGLYLCLHLLEGYILVPLIQRRASHLPPALTLAAQVLLGEVLGIIGLFVAAPLTLCCVVLLKMLYVEDALGDQTVNVPGEPGNVPPPANGHPCAMPGVPPPELSAAEGKVK
jgi:predicted PurR-regulated permease PerM